MKISTLLAAVGAVFVLSAGAVVAAEACECCKDAAPGAEMPCCDKMKSASVPAPPPQEPVDAPAPDGAGDRR